ncbi:MAG: hypothetical protein GWN58_63315 [Anaerolineae bacterium]|nr:hypothetical protein [Anaerolineae bacterium]
MARRSGTLDQLSVNVLLSGRLKLDGYGQGHPLSSDGTFQLSLRQGSTVQDVVRGMGVPLEQVAMTMVNGRKCQQGSGVRSGDRVILIPPDVAALWRFLGNQNLGAESVFDF